MKTLTYINGQFLEEPQISALDLSVLRGYGVMDYTRTYGGVPFRLRAHLERFVRSAELMGLEVPESIERMEAIVLELIKRGGFEESGVKVVLTGGGSEDQLMPTGTPLFFAVVYSHVPFPKRYYEEGADLVTFQYQRHLPLAKSTQYGPTIVALKKSQALDVLFYDEQGWIRETGTANFFAVKGGKILTPEKGILEGITRDVVMELCDVEVREIHLQEMEEFEGAFLTSSNKEVMPVRSI
ncbi:MAG: aminotransferase class IV family protein, partial [Chlamydiia bacterium]|nr:aminotransferase class IV family protein [Chlamydiia bacterium]